MRGWGNAAADRRPRQHQGTRTRLRTSSRLARKAITISATASDRRSSSAAAAHDECRTWDCVVDLMDGATDGRALYSIAIAKRPCTRSDVVRDHRWSAEFSRIGPELIDHSTRHRIESVVGVVIMFYGRRAMARHTTPSAFAESSRIAVLHIGRSTTPSFRTRSDLL